MRANSPGRKIVLTVLGVMLWCVLCGAAADNQRNDQNNAQKEEQRGKTSYSVGYRVGGDMKSQGIEINARVLLKGVEDAIAGREPLLNRQEMRKALVDLQSQVVKDEKKKVAEEAAANLAAGRKFLEENAGRPGVVTLPSGLQYRIIREGTGRRPRPGDTVTVLYRGTLIDGTEVDSSYAGGNPVTFRADRVIPGWKEALALMNEGAKWQLFLPPALAYAQRRNGRIGPNSTLIFELELLSVNGNASVKD
ncbi:MAG: FKBP-type peptidyl-prolyl cis-trans isomerase [Nitrospiraceae bacterium]|nr:FKBP-type peptidyl-prolyl cis-trans isomerase [Nitrospiraceae bacterium]